MKYIERERCRAIAQRAALFGDPGQGMFRNRARDFVLADPKLNLWSEIVEDAISYFNRHSIAWWYGGASNLPTGHLLSSQIACVNHLFPARKRQDIATSLLQGLDTEIVSACIIDDDGYVAFEFIGSDQRLKERSFTRGANCTSLDAAMIGITASGEKRLFLIEWKYVEAYPVKDKYIPQRSSVYDAHITDPNGPIIVDKPANLYFEPFYQLMRQTLLGWLMIKAKDLGCTSYRHVHVAPADNHELLQKVTSPNLSGDSLYDAWHKVLRSPDLFIHTTPETLLAPWGALNDTTNVLAYLARRYWPTTTA